MKEFSIEVRETLARVITVKAGSKEEAYQVVRNQYHKEEIVLTAEDFQEVEFIEL